MDPVRSPERHRTSFGHGQRIAAGGCVAALVLVSGSLVWQRHQTVYQRHPNEISFRDWRIGDFAVWGSKLHGTHAAIDMLLPLAAVAFGLTALGIVFLICANAAS